MKRVIKAAILVIGLSCTVNAAQLDLSADTVPRNFKGDDIIKIFLPLCDGHFDRSVAEQIYVFKLADEKVYASLTGVWIEKMTRDSWQTMATIDEKYGPTPARLKAKFDEQRARIGLPPDSNNYSSTHRSLYFMPEDHYLVKNLGTKESSFIGQNVFGARVRVERTTETKYFVTPINGTGNIGKLNIKPGDAKVGILFIGKPARHPETKGKESYVSFPGGQGSYGATFDSPIARSNSYRSIRLELQEVWVYDQNSGRIFLKQKIVKK